MTAALTLLSYLAAYVAGAAAMWSLIRHRQPDPAQPQTWDEHVQQAEFILEAANRRGGAQ